MFCIHSIGSIFSCFEPFSITLIISLSKADLGETQLSKNEFGLLTEILRVFVVLGVYILSIIFLYLTKG
jgi:hypothetical protein